MPKYPRIASFKSVAAFRKRLQDLKLAIECDETVLSAPESPLARSLDVDGFQISNRWVIHPMEGWDAEEDGSVSELVRRRWRNFGRSGAKWIWGGEAMAVLPEARANPRQLVINDKTRDGLARLHEELLATHRAEFGTVEDLLVGFQLTHSGRFSRPSEAGFIPKTLYKHPVLDRKFSLANDHPILSDDEISRIVESFIDSSHVAEQCGAQFVDIKHCHGYLGHEFLSAYSRRGRYGGPFENRTRFLREVVAGIRAATSLKIAVRLSAFDLIAFRPDPDQDEGASLGLGIPEDHQSTSYEYAFGVNSANPVHYEFDEAKEFLRLLRKLGIRMVNISAGSPYYNPHIQRPALFPPSDGYQPPEDPLIGCARQIEFTGEIKKQFPDLVIVGTAYSYLQEYLPHVAQWAVRTGRTDAVGLGRMTLAYPTLPSDTLRNGRMETKRLCRTFSDCTTGPRNGLVSGCYPLDPYYRQRPEAQKLKQIKAKFT